MEGTKGEEVADRGVGRAVLGCDAGVVAEPSTRRDSRTSESPSPNSIFDASMGAERGGVSGVRHTPDPGSPGSGRDEGDRMVASKAASSSVRGPGASCKK